MKRLLFLCSLCLIPTVYAGTCRPIYNMSKNWGGLPPTWGSYKRYNRCCLNQDFYIDLQFGAYQLDMPGFSFGEILDPLTGFGREPLPEFSIKKDRVNACYPRVAIGVEMNNGFCPCWVGSSIFFEVGASYVERDKFSEVGNGVFTNFALPIVDGSDDFIAETTGVTTFLSGVDFKRNYRYGNVALKLGSSIISPSTCQSYLIPFIETDFSYLHQEYKAAIGSINGGVTASQFFLKETLNTQYFDYGIGIDLYRALTPSCRTLFVFGGATFFGSCAHTELEAREQAIFPLVSTTLVKHSLDRSLDRLSYKARGQAGFGYKFGYNFSIALMGQVDHWGYVPKVVNPHRIQTSPGGTGVYDRPAHIESKSATNWAIAVNLNFVFF